MLTAIPQGDHPENYRQGCLESLFFLLDEKGLTNRNSPIDCQIFVKTTYCRGEIVFFFNTLQGWSQFRTISSKFVFLIGFKSCFTHVTELGNTSTICPLCFITTLHPQLLEIFVERVTYMYITVSSWETRH